MFKNTRAGSLRRFEPGWILQYLNSCVWHQQERSWIWAGRRRSWCPLGTQRNGGAVVDISTKYCALCVLGDGRKGFRSSSR